MQDVSVLLKTEPHSSLRVFWVQDIRKLKKKSVKNFLDALQIIIIKSNPKLNFLTIRICFTFTEELPGAVKNAQNVKHN